MDFWEFVWGSLIVMAYIALLFTWFFACMDLFRRRDIGGWMKALWLVIILFLPIFGLLLYFLFRPAEAEVWGTYPYTESYSSGQAGEIEALTRLRDQGTITEAEYVQMKQRVITETPAPPQPA